MNGGDSGHDDEEEEEEEEDIMRTWLNNIRSQHGT